jgi:predicted outer membrane protein
MMSAATKCGLGAVGLVAISLVACAHGGEANHGWYSTTTLTSGDVASIDDAQIAEIDRAALAAATAEAITAADHAHDPGVAALAFRIRDDDGMLLRDIRALLRRESVTPQSSPLSGRITARSRESESRLAWYQRDDFDERYVRRAVEAQQGLLDSLDSTLIRAAVHPQLQSVLLRTRAIVAQDLGTARRESERLLTKP